MSNNQYESQKDIEHNSKENTHLDGVVFSFKIPFIDYNYGFTNVHFGLFVELVFIVVLILLFKFVKFGKFFVVFELLFEKMYDFFEGILGKKTNLYIKIYVISLFFLIFFSNFFGVVLDFIYPIFGTDINGVYNLEHYIKIPTSDQSYNIGMAIISVLLILFVQLTNSTNHINHFKRNDYIKYFMYSLILVGVVYYSLNYFKIDFNEIYFLYLIIGILLINGIFYYINYFGKSDYITKIYYGGLHFIHDYFPIFGKDNVKVEKGNMNLFVYVILYILVKSFDIVLSIFLGFLEIIGVFAKIISLSFRLYGNMLAGSILVAMLVVALSGFTKDLIGFQIPLLFTLILYLQGLLVALIQAFVFSLLISIFIKVSSSIEDSH